ncbi:MAG TPA: phage tail sheath subtilisin-like domain-containing protein [Gaiellaceae bacterium]|nr:phage tail sheath subtilisin-like domain-containing protein [Gaiellaceae bacterium]
MPEYLAPGVYVEEVSFRSKSIEGVSTTTTGFVGPTRYGPLYDPPDVLTSLAEFEAVYGDGQQLDFDGTLIDNYMWHATRAFFTEGGKRLYVKRIYQGLGQSDPANDQGGRATGTIGSLSIEARHPGAYGNFHVRITLVAGPSVLATQGTPPQPAVRGVSDFDVVLLRQGATTTFLSADSYLDEVSGQRTWRFVTDGASPVTSIELADLDPVADSVQAVTASVSVALNEPGAVPTVWAGIPLDPRHQLGGAPDSLAAVFDETAHAAQLMPIIIGVGTLETGLEVLQTLLGASPTFSPPDVDVEAGLLDSASSVDNRSLDVLLHGGNDGEAPSPEYWEGTQRLSDDAKTGLLALEDLDDISIVAAPGSTHGYGTSDLATQDIHAIVNSLIVHAQKMRYRIAVVDSGNGMTVADVRTMRAQFDSSYAAFYYPWVQILDPITNVPNDLPPSGFVAGIYARNDTLRAVYKAPANEVVTLAIGFERLLNKGQQEVLNPEGINAFRFFEGRGFRLWGARTMSSDSEWKYVNLRRYFAFLEHSIDRGTQGVVFEPNGEALWANVRHTIDDFLFDQWQNGALLGDKPEKAYFVRCDRSTMTQNDLDNGRLVCLIGVAPLRPAEFVIFRIGQWTADAKK